MANGFTPNFSEEDLACPICLEEFNLLNLGRHPYILSCSHTFCYECLKTVYENNGWLKCSLCRTIHSVSEIEDLMYNYDIIEYLRKKQTRDGISENKTQEECERFFKCSRPPRWIWGSAEQQLPQHSVFTGISEDGEVSVGMAKHRGGFIPGMVVPRKRICYIPWGGQAMTKEHYYILDNPGDLNFYWENAINGNVPLSALKGGKSEDGVAEPLYIAKVNIGDATFFGKVHPSHGVCYIPYKGLERSFTDYEVLCSSELQCRFVNIRYPLATQWVSRSGGHTPRNPISGGFNKDGEVLVGMAIHEGGHILGVILPKENKCYIPWGTHSIEKVDYYVLDNPGEVALQWESASDGSVPAGALKAGRNERGEPLFIGKVKVNSHLTLCGKIHPSHHVCYIPHNGREHSFRRYKVLCATDCHNNYVKLP